MNTKNEKFYVLSTVVCAIVAAIANFGTYFWTDPMAAANFINETVKGTAVAPYRYRVLAPWIVQQIADLLNFEGLEGLIPAIFAFWILSYILLFLAMYHLLRIFYSPFMCQVGILIMVVSFQVTFDGAFQPSTVLEAAMYTIALILIESKRNWALLIVLIIATLNRETSCFIVMFYAARWMVGRWPFFVRKDLIWIGAYSLVWLAIFIELRLWLGSVVSVLTVSDMLAENTTIAHIALTLGRAVLFMGAYWLVMYTGFGASSTLIKRAWIVVPIYLLAIGVFGIWREVRLLVPLYPILISTVIAQLRRMKDED
jgi:hypothetical protein